MHDYQINTTSDNIINLHYRGKLLVEIHFHNTVSERWWIGLKGSKSVRNVPGGANIDHAISTQYNTPCSANILGQGGLIQNLAIGICRHDAPVFATTSDDITLGINLNGEHGSYIRDDVDCVGTTKR